MRFKNLYLIQYRNSFIGYNTWEITWKGQKYYTPDIKGFKLRLYYDI